MSEESERDGHRQAWWSATHGMDKASGGFSQSVKDVLRFKRELLDDDFYDDLHEVLLAADAGPSLAEALVERLRRRVKDERIASPEAAMRALKWEMLDLLNRRDRILRVLARPSVVLVVGVNGNGKTTTVGKLAWRLRQDGHRALVAAADTYRAAAIDQLRVWAERAGAELVANQPGGDPAAVTYDAVQAGIARGVTSVIVDTAGRLHTKAPLMEELKKIRKVTQRLIPEAPHEVLLVLEAPTGMNALNQVRAFDEALGLTGLVLTKLDGTARGGTLLQVEAATGIPVKLVGMGEGIDDLGFFDSAAYLDALFRGVLEGAPA